VAAAKQGAKVAMVNIFSFSKGSGLVAFGFGSWIGKIRISASAKPPGDCQRDQAARQASQRGWFGHGIKL